MRYSHPDEDLNAPGTGEEARTEPPMETEEEIEEPASLGGFDFAGAIKMAQPFIKQAVADSLPQALAANLSAMDIPTLMRNMIREEIAPTVADFNSVKVQLQPLIDAIQAHAGGQADAQAGADVASGNNGARSPVLSPKASSLLDVLVEKGIGKLMGGDGGGGGTGIESLLKQQVQIGQLVDAFTKPYRDAEESTLKRVGMMLGIGGKAGMTAKETMEKMLE